MKEFYSVEKCKQIKLPPGYDADKTLYPIIKLRTFNESVNFCRERGQVLGSLHDVGTIEYVRDYLRKCGWPLVPWNVGLRLDALIHGSWYDGTEFNYTKHIDLFPENPYFPGDDCIFPLLVPVYSRELDNSQGCGRKTYFFCTGGEPLTTPPPTTTTTTTTTTVLTTTTLIAESFDWKYCIIAIILALSIVLLVTFLFFKRRHNYLRARGDEEDEVETGKDQDEDRL